MKMTGVEKFIKVVFIVGLISLGFAGYYLYKGITTVRTVGLKNIVESVWEGSAGTNDVKILVK